MTRVQVAQHTADSRCLPACLQPNPASRGTRTSSRDGAAPRPAQRSLQLFAARAALLRVQPWLLPCSPRRAVLSARLARDWLPRSSLADQYFRSYAVGFSGVALALKVGRAGRRGGDHRGMRGGEVPYSGGDSGGLHCSTCRIIQHPPPLPGAQVIGGYMREADLAVARVTPSEEFVLAAGRLAAWPSLLLSHYLLPAASLPGHVCGIATGVLHIYGGRALGWLLVRLRLDGGRRRLHGGRLLPGGRGSAGRGAFGHPGLGWLDLSSHLLLGAGTLLITAMAARQAGGGRGGRA